MSPPQERHESRNVTGRAMTIQLRCFAKEIRKLDAFLLDYKRQVQGIFFRLRGSSFDRKLGVNAMAKEIMRAEKASLEGVQAHAREMKLFAKYLGLIRTDNIVTSRGEYYISLLESEADKLPILREYAITIKLMCPQIRNYSYREGQNQASYANYRIRPVYLVMYAVQAAEKLGVEIDSDDIALTVLRFFPPYVRQVVSESSLKNVVDDYLKRKAKSEIDYEAEFRELYKELLKETKGKFDDEEFKQKVRNSSNNVWCFLIFLRDVGLIEAEEASPEHWSSTRQVPKKGRTFPTKYQILRLTKDGERLLSEAEKSLPIWYEEIKESFQEGPVLAAIKELAEKRRLDERKTGPETIKTLTRLGLTFRHESNFYYPERLPLFDPEYDVV